MRMLAITFAATFSLALSACEKDQYTGAEAEVGKETINPDLPKVPDFTLPPPGADGAHSVKELRVKGRKFFDQEVTVKGYVTWIYDCVTALTTPDQTPDEVKKAIDEDPTRCKKPQLRIGDAADTPEEQTVRVVEIPRLPTDTEKKNLDKKELADPNVWRPVPPLKVGDEIEVVGDFKQRAPHGDSDMGGLVVYKTMNNTTEKWTTADALAALPKKKGAK